MGVLVHTQLGRKSLCSVPFLAWRCWCVPIYGFLFLSGGGCTRMRTSGEACTHVHLSCVYSPVRVLIWVHMHYGPIEWTQSYGSTFRHQCFVTVCSRPWVSVCVCSACVHLSVHLFPWMHVPAVSAYSLYGFVSVRRGVLDLWLLPGPSHTPVSQAGETWDRAFRAGQWPG